MSKLFEKILAARGLEDPDKRAAFLSPVYETAHDPFLLPDMEQAVERLVRAHDAQEKVTIYGDYDIDGLTATTVLLDALESFGFQHVETFIPNRFVEGYGLTVDAVERIAATGANLIVTVDCGSLSEKEIVRAGELGVDVIVTDHHNVAPVQPPAVAVINPKRLLQEYPEAYENYVLRKDFDVTFSDAVGSRHDDSDSVPLSAAELAEAQTSSPSKGTSSKSSGLTNASSKGTTKSPTLYPFLDLPGVGVAFKLVQALQTRLDGLPDGQEKWLLDLVALGTVCDVVTLQDENRMHVYWGLKVLAKTRRPGLKALMAVAGVEARQVNARHLGFGLGPRMNAAGRLETALYSLEMLRSSEGLDALEKARKLDEMNAARRAEQDEILKDALVQAEKLVDDPVLVVSAPGWNHGIVGIVAAKLLEKYKKPTYVLAEDGDMAKGSARSYGDFSAADAIRAADDIITKGGGHKLAAGVTLPAKNIAAFRQRVNEFYRTKNLFNQANLLLPRADITVVDFAEIDEALLVNLSRLEPFGNSNAEPVIKITDVLVTTQRRMGADAQHVKLDLQDKNAKTMQMLAFNAEQEWLVEPGQRVNVWFQPGINEWRGRRSVEGRIVRLEIA